MNKNCPECNHQLEENLMFCPFCGNYFSKENFQGSETCKNIETPLHVNTVTDSYKPKKSTKKLLIFLIVLIVTLITSIVALAIGIIPNIF